MKNTFVTGIISLIAISGLAILWAVERAKPHASTQFNSQTASGYGVKLLPMEVSTTIISNTSVQFATTTLRDATTTQTTHVSPRNP